MIPIRPISDLKNKFPEIEKIVNEGQPVYLTKNGHRAMVAMSLEHYPELIDGIEYKLDEADQMAKTSNKRLSHETVFKNIREMV